MTVKRLFLLSSAVFANESQVHKGLLCWQVERDISPPFLSGEELYNVVLEYGDIMFGFQSSK